MHRLPVLERTGIRKFYNGPESFTPDNQFILGESPEVAGFFVGAGLQLGRHRVGRWRRAGAGRVGRRRRAAGGPRARRHPSVRPVPRQHRRGCATRVSEVLGLHYAVPWPNRELDTGSAASGARRSTTGSRPPEPGSGRRWAGSARTTLRRSGPRRTTGRRPTAGGGQAWHDWVDERAARHPRGRRPVRPDLVRQAARRTAPTPWPCSTSSAPPTSTGRWGRRSTPAMLNARGGYEADVTVDPGGRRRVAARDQRRLAGARRRLAAAPRRPRVAGGSSRTSPRPMPCFGVMGPRSRELLRPTHQHRPRRGRLPVRDEPAGRPRACPRARARA